MSTLTMSLVSLSMAVTSGCTDEKNAPPTPTGPSADIVFPYEIVSANGTLSTKITVKYADNTLIERDVTTGVVTSRPIHTRTYNGSIPGPVLRMRGGEKLDIDLVNDLPPNLDEGEVIAEVNFPHHTNSTNFHTHGLHVEPTGDGDNSLRENMPGTSAKVSMTIPANHNPGTFWYHGHKHGANMAQFLSGMWGAIIFEGDVDQVPEIAAATERVLVFGELGVDKNGLVPEANPDAFFPGDVYIKERIFPINGIVNPIIRIRPGEVQRWSASAGTCARPRRRACGTRPGTRRRRA
jgi:FtsP/CotA-like multicopper oxidase with cupredoxin domain